MSTYLCQPSQLAAHCSLPFSTIFQDIGWSQLRWTQNVVYARIAIAQILHSEGYTLQEIGSMLNMTHSNVINYIKTFDDRLKYDLIFANTYNEFKEDCD